MRMFEAQFAGLPVDVIPDWSQCPDLMLEGVETGRLKSGLARAMAAARGGMTRALPELGRDKARRELRRKMRARRQKLCVK